MYWGVSMKYAYMLLITLLCSLLLVTNVSAISYQDVSLAGTTKTERDSKCKAVLGDPENPDDFAYLLQDIFNVIKFGTPILIIAMTIVEYIKAVISSDKDQLTKANKKTIQRVVLGIVLFCIPVVLNFTFNLLGFYGTCGID